MYKKIVVGVAIIISPLQTYITYLAVKAGWDKAQIGRFVRPIIHVVNKILNHYHQNHALSSYSTESQQRLYPPRLDQ
jgi:hypothetical protein